MLKAAKPEKIHEKKYQKSILLNIFMFFLLGLAVTVSRWVSIAIFSNKVGAESLSNIYFIKSIGYFFIALFVVHGLSKYRVLSFIRFIFLACFVVLFCDGFLFFNPSLFPIKYAAGFLIITVMLVGSIVEMLMWICAAQFFSSQHAKKVYAYLGVANAGGILLGSMLMYLFSSKVDTSFYIFICAVCMIASYFLVMFLQKKCWHANYQEDVPVKLKKFLQFIIKSSDWLKIMFITIMLFCFYYIADFQLAVVGEHTYKNLSELTQFFGLFQIFNSTVMLSLSYFFVFIISRLGVWNAWMFSFLSMAFAFCILGITGEKIYSAAISRIVVELFSALGFILIGIVCKNAKQKYQVSLMTFFDFVPVCMGTLLASFFGYLLKINIFSFNFLAFLVAAVAFSIFLWGGLTKRIYVSILKEGITDEQSQFLKDTIQEDIVNVGSIASFQNALSKWDSNTKKMKTLSLEIPMKIENVESLKLFLNILEGLQDKDFEIRIKGLKALTRFKNVREITPFIVKCFEDSDPFVLGQAILTLYEFDPQLTYQKADNVINALMNAQLWPYRVLAFEIIHLLKIKRYSLDLSIAMNDLEDKIRRAAYKAYGSLFEMGDENALLELKSHMGEQNNEAAKELINTILLLVGDKIDLFTDSILAKDPFLWKNTVELIVKLRARKEYELMVFSGINKLHHAYENLQAISILLKEPENYYINALLQHLSLQNAIIINGIILILTKDAFDQHVVDSIGKEVRSIVPDVKSTALELIENIGDPRLSKHFISYFAIESDEERISYAKKTWHIKVDNIQDIFSELLVEDNEWIKACVVYLIGLSQNAYFIKTLENMIHHERSLFVVENAKKALMKIRKVYTASSNEEHIDFMDLVVFLKSTVLFGEIHLNKLGAIAKFLEQKYYKPGSIIIEEGKKTNGMYILYKGSANIKHLNAEITAPTVVGIQSMLENIPSTECIEAKTKVTALFVSKKVYQNIVILHPEVGFGLLHEVCADLRRYQDKLDKM